MKRYMGKLPQSKYRPYQPKNKNPSLRSAPVVEENDDQIEQQDRLLPPTSVFIQRHYSLFLYNVLS